jgi:hypothetical protein
MQRSVTHEVPGQAGYLLERAGGSRRITRIALGPVLVYIVM